MWIMLRESFLSIVDKAKTPGCLVVRARRKGDIERVFPGVKAYSTSGTDYAFRAEIPRNVVANAIAEQVLAIDYSNYKGAVRDKAYHDALMRVWHVMGDLQPGGPYGHGKARARRQGNLL